MNFLFPSVLFGLGLIAIPIIIHFFNFQRAKRVEFTNVEFLRTVKEVTNSRNKLKNILVLLSRILFIACLVFAFARPFIPQNDVAGVETGNHVSIYLDNSFSMENERDGQKLRDLAINLTDQITESFPKNTVFQLLDNRFEGSMSYFAEGSKISEKLGTMESSNTGRNLGNVWERQKSALLNANAGKGNQVFWLSDFQKGNTPNLNELNLDSAQNFYLIPLTPNSTSNVFVDSVWLETPFVKVKENNTLNIKVRNEGNETVEDKLVKLFLEDKQVSSATVTISANASKVLSLNFAVAEGGQKMGKIAIEDFPVTFDNDYFFVLKVAPKINIVSIVGDESNYVEQVYSNEPFFEVKQFSINSLDYASLNSADLIVLTNLEEIDNGLQVAISKAIANGSSLAVFPSATANASSYSNLLSLNVEKQVISQSDQMLEVSVPDTKNPFFEGVFEKVQQNMNMPKGFQSISWNRSGETLLQFKNGQTFLSQLSNGGSSIFAFSTPLDTKYSDFPKHAVFVPIMYKIALASKSKSERLAYSFSEEIATVVLDEIGKGDVFKLQKDDFEFIPSQRMLDKQLLISIPKSGLEAGNYQILHTKTGEEAGKIAFNYDKSESKLTNYSAEDLKAQFENQANIQIYENVELDQFAKNFQDKTVSNQLWRYFIVLALLFLLVEVLLVRFWRR